MKIALSISLTFLVCLVFAQESNNVPIIQNSISLSPGYIQFKDENLHPKVFHGISAGASYHRTKINRNIAGFSAGLRFSFMSTANEEFPGSTNILLLGSYRYLFHIISGGNMTYHLGPAAGLQYGTSAYFNWDESHFYFANYLGGGIANRVSYRMGDRLFGLNLEIPVISCICRPEYNRQYKIDEITFSGILKNLASNPEVAFPGRNFYLKSGLEMIYLSKAGKTRSIGYNFLYHYMRASEGNPYRNLEHSITYSFIF